MRDEEGPAPDDDEAAVEAASWAEGTNEGEETDKGAEMVVGRVVLDMVAETGELRDEGEFA